jgi:UBX domain-containing protein 1
MDEGEPEKRLLTFWSDGFSVDDGPLLRYDDPANKELLDSLNQGRAPQQLLGLKFGQRVDIQVAQRLTEAYRPQPKGPAKPFEGSGNRLGAPAPEASSSSAPPKSPERPQSFVPASVQFEVDQSRPVTSLQIRLTNGERVVGRFNHDHTVADIRRYVNASVCLAVCSKCADCGSTTGPSLA